MVYLTQGEFGQLDITAIDQILNDIHRHRSLMDGQEVFAMQARAVITHGRNKPPEPAPRPQPNDNEGNSGHEVESDPADPESTNADTGSGGNANGPGSGTDPGAARSKRELRDVERRAARLVDYPEIADALAAGEVSTEQADLISRAAVSARTKLELLAEAKHEHADQTAQAVKTATKTVGRRHHRQHAPRPTSHP
ncbi:hypothetical protein JYT71_00925 [Acidimicrobiaceae bacterium AH-315-P05]|nr:hypothetical protein [Acidimicrobiaceae bacterium AH-315-P05]